VKKAEAFLYTPREAYRGLQLGGARFNYYLAKLPDKELSLEILDENGKVIRTVKGKPGETAEADDDGPFAQFFGGGRAARLPVKAGLNTFTWDLRREPPKRPEGVVHWGGLPGMVVVPGSYQARLTSGSWSETRRFEVKINPRLKTTVADYQKQFELAQEVSAKIEDVFRGITQIRDVKTQSKSIVDRLKSAGMENEEVAKAATSLTDKLTKIEEQLTQVKSKSNQDPINFPPMLDNQLTALYTFVVAAEYQPTAGAYERFDHLEPQVADLLGQLRQVLEGELSAFNQLVSSKNIPPVVIATRRAETDGGR
jgi:hypothetical protein